MNQNIIKGIGQIAEGFFKVLVVDAATEKVVSEQPWQKNLILNQGMESVAVRVWADQFAYAICGTGTRPNSIDSSTDVADQVGTTVTSVGGTVNFTTDAVVGDMIKWDSGSESRITSITGALIVEVTPSQSVGSGEYTIWKTAQVGLQTEIKRTLDYLTGSGNCETTQSGTTIQMRRTYDHTTEVGPITYTEVGVGWSLTLSTTVFSRILLNTPIALVAGQKLRMVYQLNVTLSPSTPVLKNLAVGGWPVAPSTTTDGQECIQCLNISGVNVNGNSSAFAHLNVLDPAAPNSPTSGRMMAVSTNSTALSAFGSAPSRATTAFMCSNVPTNASYSPLSFQLDVSSVFQVADAVSSSIRCVILGGRSTSAGYFPYDSLRQSFVFLFNEVQAKTNTQTLTFTVRFTWGRVLA